MQKQQAFTGVLGPDRQRAAFAAFEESPGVQFAREQGLRGIESEAAVTGGLGGGDRLRELTKFSQGLALQDFQNQFNRLGATSEGEQALAGRQLAATSALGNLRAGFGAQQAGSIIGGGEARAEGRVAQAAGLRSGVAQVAQLAALASDVRLKTNIEQIDTLSSGIGWYTWDWTEDAKELFGHMPTEGVIAQEAQKVFPDAVKPINGILHVDYARIH